MREIKYRGYRNYEGNSLYPPDKRWIYGYYYFEDGKHWIKDAFDIGMTYVVEEGSVGQFIGIPDKNCKEIYEGDRLQWRWYGKDKVNGELLETEVTWNDFLLQWFAHPNLLHRLTDEKSELEVIGNTTENPELTGERQ